MKEKLSKSEGFMLEIIQPGELLPDEKDDYFLSLHRKHFVRESAVGSLFTEVRDLPQLLSLAEKQRPDGLVGDDRTTIAAMGVAPGSLLPQCRYLLIKTPGEVGIVNLSEVDQAEPVYVNRTKPGAPCTLSVVRENMPETDIATIIIGPNESENPSTREMVWTVHPGLPIRPAQEDFWPDGSVISAQEAIEKLGADKFINVRCGKL